MGKNGRGECKKCHKDRNKCHEERNNSPDDCDDGAMVGPLHTIAPCDLFGKVPSDLGAKSVQSSANVRQWLPRLLNQGNNTPDGGRRGAMG